MNVLGTVSSFSQLNCEKENKLENGRNQETGAAGEDFKGGASGGQQNRELKGERGKETEGQELEDEHAHTFFLSIFSLLRLCSTYHVFSIISNNKGKWAKSKHRCFTEIDTDDK